MVYRFQTPQQAPVAPPGPSGSGGHRIANTLMMIRQAMDRKRRLEHDKAQAEEQRRQFGVQSTADRKKLQAQMADWDAKRKTGAERLAVAQERLALAKNADAREAATTAKGFYESQTEASQANRPGQAEAYSEMAAMMPNMPAPVVALYKAAQAAAAEKEKAGNQRAMMGMAGFGTGPGPEPEEEGPAATPEYGRAVEDVSSALAPMLELGSEDEKAAAAMVMKQVPGLIEANDGDMVKAKNDALKLTKEAAARLAKERQSKRGAAAAMRAAAGRGENFDRLGFTSGFNTVSKVNDKTGGYESVNAWVDARKALEVLSDDRFGSNPKVVGNFVYKGVEALSGQKGRAISDKDADRTMAESILEKGSKWVALQLKGESGDMFREQVRQLLEAGSENAYQGAVSSYRRARGAADAMGSAAGGRAGGRDFTAGAETGMVQYLPVLEEMERRGELDGGGSGGGPKSLDEATDEDIDNMSAEELRALLEAG